MVRELGTAAYRVVKVDRRERRRNPAAPFITSKLQQEAANRLHFSAKKTMTLAQRLYEGVELGEEGSVGLISYMRTDSTRLSDDAIADARALIAERYGKDFVPAEPNVFRQSKRAQDAHEAIRPTSLEWTPERVQSFLDPDMFRLYELIWNRFLACQMAPAVYDLTSIDIEAGRAMLRATGTILKFAGYLAVYGEKPDEVQETPVGDGKEAEEPEAPSGELPSLEAGDELSLEKLLPEQHFTQPPPRFTEASLVKELEEKGIGRPSTYAAILSVIQDKEYAEKRENRFYPTELGTLVNELLVKAFPNVVDVGFTAAMEEQLDEIAEGGEDWVHVLDVFYDPFKKELAQAEEHMRDVKREETPTDLKCEKCGSGMVIKWGKMGRFLACSGYPECKTTTDFETKPDGTIVLGEGAGDRQALREMRQAHGGQAWSLWSVPGLHWISRVQVQPAPFDRHCVPSSGLHRRAYRAADPPGQDLLRLQSLSGVHFRRLGQARGGEMPRMRESLPSATVQQKRGHDGGVSE